MKRLILVLLAVALPATSAWSKPPTEEEFLRTLAERDRVIAALEKRVEALEGAQHGAPQLAQASPAPAVQAPLANSAPTASPQPAVRQSASVSDDDVALQALSRTLVARGALVMPEWGFELAPGVQYSHNQNSGLVLEPTPEGIPTVDSQRLREDSIKATVTARLGLPWDSEIELRAPFSWTEENVTLGDGTHQANHSFDIGDVEAEFSNQVLRTDGLLPDLVAAASVRVPTGRDPFRASIPDLASGQGTYEVGGRLTALESADPMVFFATLTYAHEFSKDEPIGRVRPGSTIGLDMGGILAVSPQTSLTLGFTQAFTGQTLIDGISVPGTDRVPAALDFGVDYVLRPNTLLDFSLAVGVTNDAPNYSILVSLPIRF
jgi:hypothetical protein